MLILAVNLWTSGMRFFPAQAISSIDPWYFPNSLQPPVRLPILIPLLIPRPHLVLQHATHQARDGGVLLGRFLARPPRHFFRDSDRDVL
jgi:hypothetical protein